MGSCISKSSSSSLDSSTGLTKEKGASVHEEGPADVYWQHQRSLSRAQSNYSRGHTPTSSYSPGHGRSPTSTHGRTPSRGHYSAPASRVATQNGQAAPPGTAHVRALPRGSVPPAMAMSTSAPATRVNTRSMSRSGSAKAFAPHGAFTSAVHSGTPSVYTGSTALNTPSAVPGTPLTLGRSSTQGTLATSGTDREIRARAAEERLAAAKARGAGGKAAPGALARKLEEEQRAGGTGSRIESARAAKADMEIRRVSRVEDKICGMADRHCVCSWGRGKMRGPSSTGRRAYIAPPSRS